MLSSLWHGLTWFKNGAERGEHERSQGSARDGTHPEVPLASLPDTAHTERRADGMLADAAHGEPRSVAKRKPEKEAEPLYSVAKKKFQVAGALERPAHSIADADFSKIGMVAEYDKDTGNKVRASKPMWILPDGQIVLESGSSAHQEAVDFLVAIAEPECRTRFLHEYKLTEFSLYAAASMGITTELILKSMVMFSKTDIPDAVKRMVEELSLIHI